jgi:uncharacterized protein YnzC (UPF0291/DUF896 family)
MSFSAAVHLILLLSLSAVVTDEPAAKEEKKEGADPAVKEVPAKKKVDLKAQQAAQHAQLRKNYLQMYRPILMAELDRIRLAGEVPSEKRPLIKKMGEDEIEKIVDALVKPAQQPAVQRFLFGLPAPVRQTAIDPQQRIEEVIDKAAQEHLSSEHLAKYREERTKRNEAVKQAVIKLTVFRIDAVMRLSSGQRADLAAGLNKEWKADWSNWIWMSNYGGNVVPNIPSSVITPLLSPAQAKVWKGIQKMDPAALASMRLNGARNMGWNIGPRDDYWGKEPEPEKPAVGAAIAVPVGG